MLQNFESRMS